MPPSGSSGLLPHVVNRRVSCSTGSGWEPNETSEDFEIVRAAQRLLATGCIAATFLATSVVASSATVGTSFISQDLTTVSGAQHNTEVEPVTASWGNTIVSTFQEGRYAKQTSGAAAAGFSTSTDGGITWTSGVLPGITANSPNPSPYLRTVNMTVAYDAAHAKWIITNHAMQFDGVGWFYAALLISRSDDGIHWDTPINAVAGAGTNVIRPDKGWLVCDNFVASPYYGRCYITYVSNALKRFQNIVTTDAGLNWSVPVGTATNQNGYDPIPVVRPDGSVVVVATQNSGMNMVAFRTTDGGTSWTNPTAIASLHLHKLPAGLRTRSKPAPAVDAVGNVFVTWYDCRFRTGCTNNDIVVSHSDDGGISWTAPTRVSVDPINSTVEHFVAGIGVTPGTSGATAKINLMFYQLSNAACIGSACLIYAVSTSSNDGGTTWSPTANLNSKPMKTYMLAQTTLGRMLSDYHTIAYVNNEPIGAIVIAKTTTTATVSGVATTFMHEDMYAAHLS